MTAEVAIINRRGVTLAADSAVSFGPGDDVKIFDSAEKIFELCEHLPVGLMIFNGVDLLRTPLELIARDFRNNYVDDADTLKQCADDFLKYLEAFAAASPVFVQEAEIEQRTYELMSTIYQRAFDAFMAQPGGANPRQTPQQVSEIILDEELSDRRAGKLMASHGGLTWSDAYAKHKDAIDKGIARSQLAQLRTHDLREIASRALLSEHLSEGYTGIVVAGYGKKGLFPCLYAYQVDGFVCGKLRCAQTHDVAIDLEQKFVDIITFAQEDVSRRLLDGIDPEIDFHMFDQLRGGVEQMRKAVLANVGAGDRAKVEADFDAAASKLTTNLNDTMDNFIDKCRTEFELTVAVMPKQEMASIAEALVNTTAMKRRVSTDREDVGGPVDVATISRHDGFIWVKRKHYFEPDRNLKFVARKSAVKSTDAKKGGTGAKK